MARRWLGSSSARARELPSLLPIERPCFPSSSASALMCIARRAARALPTVASSEAVRARGHFPTEQAALKCLYLATRALDPTGKGKARWATRWKPALNAFAITFEGRITLNGN